MILSAELEGATLGRPILTILIPSRARSDLVVAAPAYPGSQADKKRVKAGKEKIKSFYPDVDISQYWRLCQKAKLGNLEYELEIIS